MGRYICKSYSIIITAPFWECASMEHLGWLVLHLGLCRFRLVADIEWWYICSSCGQNEMGCTLCHILTISIDELSIVLARGPYNLPEVRVCTAKNVSFCSKQVQKHDLHQLGGVVMRTGHRHGGFGTGLIQTAVPFYSSYNLGLTFSPIQYLSTDHIMTWSICRLGRFSLYFTSRFQICNATNIHLISVE